MNKELFKQKKVKIPLIILAIITVPIWVLPAFLLVMYAGIADIYDDALKGK